MLSQVLAIVVEKELCDPACFALGDVNQFDAALVNLAVNARDAMKDEAILSFKVELTTSIPAVRRHRAVQGDFVAVSVSDRDSGIEPVEIDNIFQPFSSTKEEGKGTGLGLSQVFGFAKQSRGDFDVQSEPGRTTFTLYLPQNALSPEAMDFKLYSPISAAVGRGSCVLVVEDNEAVGSCATEMLHDLGYETVWAKDAERALSLLTRDAGHFDLVFPT